MSCQIAAMALFAYIACTLDFFLVNPTVDDELTKLPENEQKSIDNVVYLGNTVCPGLAYDRHSKKYKVVELYNSKNKSTVCEILTLGDSCWRQVGGELPFKYDNCFGHPVFINDVVYWGIVAFAHIAPIFMIVAFDLETETLYLIPHPKCNFLWDNLAEYNWCLCIYINRTLKKHIFVLKDDSTSYYNRRWIKEHTIVLPPINPSIVFIRKKLKHFTAILGEKHRKYHTGVLGPTRERFYYGVVGVAGFIITINSVEYLRIM
jgi:F-box interacting protein